MVRLAGRAQVTARVPGQREELRLRLGESVAQLHGVVLAGGDSVATPGPTTLTLTAMVDVGTGGSTITNTATLTSSDPADSNPGNDSDSADITVVEPVPVPIHWLEALDGFRRRLAKDLPIPGLEIEDDCSRHDWDRTERRWMSPAVGLRVGCRRSSPGFHLWSTA